MGFKMHQELKELFKTSSFEPSYHSKKKIPSKNIYLNHCFDKQSCDDGEKDARNEFEEAVEPDIDLIQGWIRHLEYKL